LAEKIAILSMKEKAHADGLEAVGSCHSSKQSSDLHASYSRSPSKSPLKKLLRTSTASCATNTTNALSMTLNASDCDSSSRSDDDDSMQDNLSPLKPPSRTLNVMKADHNASAEQSSSSSESSYDDDLSPLKQRERHSINFPMQSSSSSSQTVPLVNDAMSTARRQSFTNCSSNRRASYSHGDRSLGVLDEINSWNHLDSVHSSRVSNTLQVEQLLNNNNNTDGSASNNDSSSKNFNDSCNSFASFGGSSDADSDDLHEIEAAVQALSQKFQNVQEDVPTPRALLLKQQSYRMQRGASFRGSLSLIQETTAMNDGTNNNNAGGDSNSLD